MRQGRVEQVGVWGGGGKGGWFGRSTFKTGLEDSPQTRDGQTPSTRPEVPPPAILWVCNICRSRNGAEAGKMDILLTDRSAFRWERKYYGSVFTIFPLAESVYRFRGGRGRRSSAVGCNGGVPSKCRQPTGERTNEQDDGEGAAINQSINQITTE